MKRIRLEHIIVWLLLVIMGLIVIHAPLTVFIGSHWPELALPIKAWKETLMLVALVLLLIEYVRRRTLLSLLRDKVVWLSVAFATLHFVAALFTHAASAVVIAGLMIDLRFVAYFVLVYAFLQLYPDYKQFFLKVGLIGAGVVLGFTLLQLVLPRDFLTLLGYGDATIQPYMTVDKNPAFVRFSSTLRGPNPLGAYALMALTAVVAFAVSCREKLRVKNVRYLTVFLGIASLIALALSYSRSAWIGVVVAVATVLGIARGQKLTTRHWALIAGVILVVIGGLSLARDTYLVKNLIIHDNPATGAAVDSNTGHVNSLLDGIARVARQPLGAGIGSTGSASLLGDAPLIIENQFLFVAHEVGWVGLGLFASLVVVILRRLWLRRDDWSALAALAAGVGLIVIGLLLPVFADDTVSLTWWGLVAAILCREQKGDSHGPTSHKKATRTA